MARQIDTIANRITLEGGAEILRFLDSLGTEGKAAATKLQDAFQKSGFDKGISTKIGGIGKSIRGLGADAKTAAAGIGPLRSALEGLRAFTGGVLGGAGLGAALGAGGLGALLASATLAVSRNANAIKDQARDFNVTTDSVQQYQEVLNKAGLQNESLGGILSTLTDKISDNEKKFKSATKEVEIFGGKTSTVVKGVAGIDEQTGKLKDSFDFKVPTGELGELGKTTVTVRRGFQELNKQADLANKLFGGLSTKNLDESLKTIAKRFKEAGGTAQTLVDAGVSLRGSRTLADFLNALAEDADNAGKKAGEAGDKIDGFVKKLTPPELDKVGTITTELDKFFTNIERLFSRNVARTGSGGFLETINQQLERMDNRQRNGQIINDLADLDRVARKVQADTQAGVTPGNGRSALFTGIEQGAADAKAAVEDTKDSLTGIKAVLMGQGDTGNQGPQGRATAESSFFTPFIDAAKTAATDAGQALSQAGQNVAVDVPESAFADLDLEAQKAAERAAAGLPAPFESAWARIESDAADALSNVKSLINSVISAIKDAIEAAANLKASASDGSGSSGGGFGGGGGSGFAWGGLIRGPGGPRGDRIPIMASDYEYVMQASATDYYGPRIMSLLNKRLIPRELFGRMGAFKDGGLIRAFERSFAMPLTHFAEGGLVAASPRAGGRPILLQLPGGQTIAGLTASNSAVNELNRATTKARLLSAGRRPTYWDR